MCINDTSQLGNVARPGGTRIKMRHIAVFLLAATALAAQTITPGAPTVAIGGSVTLTASVPVTWSLTGGGSLSTTGPSTSTVYSAPTSKANLHTMRGCQVMPDDNIFNLDVSSSSFPINANSSTWLLNSNSNTTGTGTGYLQFEPSWGIGQANASTPTRTLTSTYSLNNTTVKAATGPNQIRENGNMEGDETGDHHDLVVDYSACTFSESYKAYWHGGTETCQANPSLNTCNASSAIFYPWSNYASLPDGGTTAAGTPLAPLTMHLSDLKAGVINHMVEFTTSLGFIQGSANTGVPRLWPATNSNGGASTASPIIGSLYRLKSSFNVSAVCTGGTATANAYCTTILTGLQHHGMMLVDIGLQNSIITGTDLNTDPDAVAAIRMIYAAHIQVNSNSVQNFDILDLSALQLSPSCNPQSATCPDWYKVAPQSYASPVNQVIVSATAGSTVKTYIAVQGAAIGSSIGPDVNIQAGTGAYTLPAWVNPSTLSQSITWSLVSGVGSVSGNTYTPPSTGSGSAQVHGVAAADSNATIDLYFHVIPPGTISIMGGGLPANVTAGGFTWLHDVLPEWGENSSFPLGPQFQYPVLGTSPSPLGPILAYYQYTSGSDIVYSVVVPNGQYDVTLYNRHPANGGLFNGSWNANGGNQYTYTPSVIETNGTVVAHHWDWALLNGYMNDIPYASSLQSIKVPVNVTNNLLYVAYRGLSYDIADSTGNTYAPPSGTKTNELDALQITPDAGPGHWTIDNQQQSTIANGQTLLPFYAIDWFTGDTDVNTPTWSVNTQVPGVSVSSSGVVSFATTLPYFNGQPVVVTATGANHAASYTLYTTGAAMYALNPVPLFNHYAYKRALVIDHTKVAGADLANFPILVSVTDPTLETVANGGHVRSNFGYDIILTSDAAGTSPLNWEVEAYSATTGTWTAHVKIPTVSHTTNTTIYMFYGNPAVVSGQGGLAATVWDANFSAVYHMTNLTADSTSNANTATLGASITQAVGKIGGAASFGTIYVTATPSGVVNPTRGTIEEWVYTNGAAGNSPYSFGDTRNGAISQIFKFFETDTNLQVGWQISGAGLLTTSVPFSGFSGAWHHLVYAWDSTLPSQYAYVDGALVASDTSTAFSPAVTALFDIDGYSNYNSQGLVDEVRFSNIERSAAWLETEYASYNTPGIFVALGSETTN